LEFRRTVSVRLDEPALEAPLENLPYLYQVWGTLTVIEVLLDVVKKYAYKVDRQRLVQRDPFGLYVRVLADGGPVLVLRQPTSGAQVKLIPQRTYGRGHGLHSVSYAQIPDIAIEVSSPTRPTCVYLLDPKYRLDGEVLGIEANPDSKPTKVDIDKMHAYRDAIRDDQGNHVISYAGILYPGPYIKYVQGLEALPAYPGREDTLRDRLRVVCEQALAQ
jgi:PD-(D/E)XK nuclease superfamily